jgi:Tol biopolymer transport system component
VPDFDTRTPPQRQDRPNKLGSMLTATKRRIARVANRFRPLLIGGGIIFVWVANRLRPLRIGGGVLFAWAANRLHLLLIGGGVLLFVAAVLVVGQRIYSAAVRDPSDPPLTHNNPSEATHCAGDSGTDRRQADRGEVSNGKIAFARQNAGLANADIYVIEGDGTEETRLTNTRVSERVPVWSPDGERMAVLAEDVDIYATDYIYVMDSDGTDRTRVTHFRETVSAPGWSPDGERMVFVKQRPDLYVMDPDGTDRTLLTSSGWGQGDPPRIYGAVWSPDGEKIVFASETLTANDDTPASAGPSSVAAEGLTGIYISNADGPGLCKLTEIYGTYEGVAAAGPTWSPDGDKIAFYDNGAIYLVNPDGSGRKEKLAGGLSALTYHAWSPDGEKIAFVKQKDLYVIEADGSGLKRLTNTSGKEEALPTWSPDGKKIAFSCPFKAPDASAGHTDLCVINADGTGLKRIASNVAPEGSQVSASWARE